MALATRPKPPTHYRKRQGEHHRHSKHYLKTYWPYLPMLVTVGVGLMINSIWSAPGHVLGAASDFSSTALLTATNTQRLKATESALTLNAQLTAAAQAKANDMAAHNYWSHNSPDGRTPWSFISASGYDYAVAGENLAYGFSNADDTVTGWMNSAEHRANILDSSYQDVGFGVATATNFQGQGPETIVVAEYAAPVPAVANITFNVPDHSNVLPARSAPREISAQPVSRVQLLTGGQAARSTLALAAVAGAAIALMAVRHGSHWKKLLTRGEAYLTNHPVLDIAAMLIATAGVLLIHSAGVVR